MKIRVTMKTPDALSGAIHHCVEERIAGLSDDEVAAHEKAEDEISDLCKRWFRYGESVTVEIDTEAKTCAGKFFSNFIRNTAHRRAAYQGWVGNLPSG